MKPFAASLLAAFFLIAFSQASHDSVKVSELIAKLQADVLASLEHRAPGDKRASHHATCTAENVVFRRE
jgi:hypothetical protein